MEEDRVGQVAADVSVELAPVVPFLLVGFCLAEVDRGEDGLVTCRGKVHPTGTTVRVAGGVRHAHKCGVCGQDYLMEDLMGQIVFKQVHMGDPL